MNIEDYREYCLSLGDDVEEKLPFTAFHHAAGVLVFYVHGHMFSFFDCDHFSVVTLKYKNNKKENQTKKQAEDSLHLTKKRKIVLLLIYF